MAQAQTNKAANQKKPRLLVGPAPAFGRCAQSSGALVAENVKLFKVLVGGFIKKPVGIFVVLVSNRLGSWLMVV